MRIDSHQHYWVYDPVEYGWMGDELKSLQRNFLPDDLAPLLEKCGLDGAVVVQVRQTEEETRWMLELAHSNNHVKGVVGWVDLCAEDVGEKIARFADDPLLCGHRHILQDEPDDDFMLRDAFQHGVGQLARFGLTYDILTFPRHLQNAARLVDEFPDQPFVLNHLSKPFIKNHTLDPWTTEIRELARRPHVMCKISGMVTEADWKGWKRDDFTPYMDVVYEAFGEDRVMYGSDWPVCLLAASYDAVHEIVDLWSEDFGAEARGKLFGGNAARFYGLSKDS